MADSAILDKSQGQQKGHHKDPCIVGNHQDPNAKRIRIVHVSDTHMKYSQFPHHRRYNIESLPDGDILIHSGDIVNWDFFNYQVSIDSIKQFFAKCSYSYKIFIGGNHETHLARTDKDKIKEDLAPVIYLQDDEVTIEGIKFYGTPWNKYRGSPANAFEGKSHDLERKWEQIPDDVDVLITHNPPHGILDRRGSMGCKALRRRVENIRPKAHLFGHVHDQNGVLIHNNTVFCNAAMESDWKPKVIDYYLSPQ